MTYAEAVAHLYALGPELASKASGGIPRKFDLAHMRTLCGELGNPQDRVRSVLIAGTNGKGSTAATLASILTAAGYRTGLYTSPHLIDPNERIQAAHPVLPSEYGSQGAHGTDGSLMLTPIADDDFASLYSRVDAACTKLFGEGKLPVVPSFFERLTAMAFLYFAHSAEVMVLEVGLGGRLDATNVVEPMLSVITDIALDHQDYLGDTLTEIAQEKCGILRAHGILITLSQHPDANHAIGLAAERLQVEGVNAGAYLPPAERNGEQVVDNNAHFVRNAYGLPFGETVLHVDSPLGGSHQRRNLALAITAAKTLQERFDFDIPPGAIEAGIRQTVWPGRLEKIEPHLVLDVAHNPAGAWTLREAMRQLPQEIPRTLIFSCLREKNLMEMAQILFPLFDSSSGDVDRRADHIILAPIANPRAADVADLLAAAHQLGIPAHAAPHLEGALQQARQITPDGGMVFATGSVYLVGEIRRLVLEAHRAEAHRDAHVEGAARV